MVPVDGQAWDTDPFEVVEITDLSNTLNITDVRVTFKSVYNQLDAAQQSSLNRLIINYNNRVLFTAEPERDFFVHRNVRTGVTYCYDLMFEDRLGNFSRSSEICYLIER